MDSLSAMPSPNRVLVVDDEELNCALLEAKLSARGYEVATAADGIRALALIEDPGTDLVLLDIMMPGIDGYETCRRIREDLGLLDLPVVFVTALDDRQARIQGKGAGADDYLTKPIDDTELFARVRNLLRVKAFHDLRERQREILAIELERTREHLLHADRLATLGTLAAGVGHELANTAQLLNVYLRLVIADVADGKLPQAGDLEALQEGADQVVLHSTQLLRSGKPGPERTEELDLREVVNAVVEMLRLTGKTKYLEVEIVLPAEPVSLTINRTRLEQILVNLVNNAADAFTRTTRNTGRITVTLEADAGQACFSVADNGCGIVAEDLEEIFTPYFTTKPPDKGTGLGLPVVKGIVESLGGRVWVTSKVGDGTTVAFNLPLAANP